MKSKYKKEAFTTTEVLLTLLTIGIISAITMVSFISNAKKIITETKLKAAYSDLQQAFDMGVAKNKTLKEGDFAATGIRQEKIFSKYLQPYLKVDKVCTSYVDCGYKSETYPWKRMDNIDYGPQVEGAPSRALAKLETGVVLLFVPWTSTDVAYVMRSIFIDLDGPKGENKLGKDVFCFTIDFNTKKIIPQIYYDYTDKDKIHQTGIANDMGTAKRKCTGHGITCAAWIANSGWKIPKDYPWYK